MHALRPLRALSTAAAARLPLQQAAAASFHSSAAACAAPAAKPAAKGAPAAAGGAAPTGPSLLNTPPAEGSARWVKEGWGQPRLVPAVSSGGGGAAGAASHPDAEEERASRVLPLLHAEVREAVGSRASQHLRKQRLRIPGLVCDRAAPRTNQLLISLDRFELEQLCRTYRRTVGHRVCLLHIEGQSQPIKVIPDELQRHPVTQELLVANFFLFKPNQEKVRVNIPIVYTGAEECIGVKRGGVLVILRDSLPCVWTGDENIPPFIHLDLTNADGGKVFRNADVILPPNLRLHDPKFDYVLASVLGVKTRGREDEEVAPEAAAAATPQQPSAIQLEKEKKEKERREEEEMVAQKLAQKAAKGKK